MVCDLSNKALNVGTSLRHHLRLPVLIPPPAPPLYSCFSCRIYLCQVMQASWALVILCASQAMCYTTPMGQFVGPCGSFNAAMLLSHICTSPLN